MSGFCKQCGAAVGEGAKFCASCGAKVDSQTESEAGRASEQPPYWPPPRQPEAGSEASSTEKPPYWPPPPDRAGGSSGPTPPYGPPPPTPWAGSGQSPGRGGGNLVLKIAAGVILAVIVIGIVVGKAVNEATKKQGWSVEVTAPAGRSWSGSFGGKTVDGTGYKVVNFQDMSITAADAQKQDGGHWALKLVLYQGSKIYDTETTTAAYGVVTVQGSAG